MGNNSPIKRLALEFETCRSQVLRDEGQKSVGVAEPARRAGASGNLGIGDVLDKLRADPGLPLNRISHIAR